MNANAAPLLAIFEKKVRLEVPLFQRQYVWNREQQWEPLWEDISRKFGDALDDRDDGPAHFLGAMVLDQKQTPTTHVEKRQVIDGQQRLTTLQIFLAAFRDFCRDQECPALADECDAYLLNKGMMANPEVDRFKVWPTQLDRPQFTDVVTSGTRKELERKHPLLKKKYTNRYLPRPRMVEAYLYFSDQIGRYFLGGDEHVVIASDKSLADRLEQCFQTLRGVLKVVVIDLDQGDDAQVIFETLNARGEPLLPADLLRNFIFLRAARAGKDQEALYHSYWSRFDSSFWRETVKQGRLTRPRSDVFLQHFLASRKTVDIPIGHLFVEYRHWILKDTPFDDVEEELSVIARQGDDFRRIIAPKEEDVLYQLVTLLDAFDIRTAYPLILFLLDRELSDDEWRRTSTILESYLIRRAVCGLTTKNYNRTFLQLTRALRTGEASATGIEAYLRSLGGESTGWPDDRTFESAWMTAHAYQRFQNPKLVYILKRLNALAGTAKNEELVIKGPLTVEHIMPQSWVEHWPLSDGSRGIPLHEVWSQPQDDPRVQASKLRNVLLQTIGNLTILTQPLNAAASNSPWPVKKTELLKHSLLPLNQYLQPLEKWDDEAIARRGKILFEDAVRLWPRPG